MGMRGEITVFLSLTLVCVLSLFMGLLESARTAGARLYLTMAANSAMASVMSQYNRNLWDMYRLLFLEYGSEEAIRASFEEYLDFYLEQENLYPAKAKETRVTNIRNMDADGGVLLEEGILSWVKYRLPDIAGNLSGIGEEAASAAKAGDFKTVFKVCRQAGKNTRKLEKLQSSIEKLVREMEETRKKAKKAARDENGRRMKRETEKLLKDISQFSRLTDQYEAEMNAVLEDHKNIRTGEGSGEMDSQAAGTMDMELAAYQSVGEAAEKTLSGYREVEEILETDAEYLGQIVLLLENEEDYEENGEETPEGPDWEQIGELMELIQIPEREVPGTVDQEKSSALDRLEEMLNGNLLSLVMPEGVKISEKKVSLENSMGKTSGSEAGEKTADTGKADQEPGAEHGPAEQLLVNEYIMLYFDSFLEESESRGELMDQALDYEQEYLLCGAASDRENLTETVEQLLMIRAAMNLLYLTGSADKKAQADGLAAAVSGGNAPVQLILSFLILSLWALGEAVCDVRSLLDGGKVGIMKNDSTWKLGLDNLLALEFTEYAASTDGSGSSYGDYIRILLFLEKREQRNYRMMDVIQWNVRRKQPDFSVKDCAYQVEIQAAATQKHVFFVKDPYEQTVETAWSY